MKKYFKLIVYTLFLVSISATANTKNIIVDIDGTKIHIKAPKGFYEISSISPPIRKLAEDFTPKDTRLLGFFVNEDDLGRILKGEDPLLNPHLTIKILRDAENTILSPQDFKRSMNYLYNNYNNMIEKMSPKLQKMSEAYTEKYMSKIKVGEAVPVDASITKGNVFTGIMMIRNEINIDGIITSDVKVASASHLLIKGKMIFIEVLCTYNNKEDITWVKQKNTEWIDLLLSENQ